MARNPRSRGVQPTGLPKAAPKAPAQVPAVPAAPVVPPGFAPFVPPAKPRTPGLLGSRTPADHFAPRDPVQRTAGVRQNPPAARSRSVPADGTLPMAQPLDWQPFGQR